MAGEEPIVSGMAGRYATAIFELALEAGTLDQIRSELDAFDALAASNPDLMRLIRSPVFGAEEQSKALAAVLDRAGISSSPYARSSKHFAPWWRGTRAKSQPRSRWPNSSMMRGLPKSKMRWQQ
jgi:hypothetical protein